jgi:hypothetical protein
VQAAHDAKNRKERIPPKKDLLVARLLSVGMCELQISQIISPSWPEEELRQAGLSFELKRFLLVTPSISL